MNDLICGIDEDELVARSVFLGDDVCPLDFDGISPRSKDVVHVIVVGTDRRMLFMLRQAALLAHYVNFDDETGTNRNILTLVDAYAQNTDDLNKTKARVDSSECLSNLTKMCPWSCEMLNGEGFSGNQRGSFIDIDLHIVGLGAMALNDFISQLLMNRPSQRFTLIAYKNVIDGLDVEIFNAQSRYFQTYEVPWSDFTQYNVKELVDLRVAKRIHAVYNFTNYLGDIKACDIDNIKRYSEAIRLFAKHAKPKYLDNRWNEQKDLRLALSNVYCADCIKPKLRGLNCDMVDCEKVVSENLRLLAKCEHTRWNSEKLILGFRAWDALESYRYELLYGKEAKDFKDGKKNDESAHIDICSNRTLRRIDIESVKYDNFLMLSIPHILRDSNE